MSLAYRHAMNPPQELGWNLARNRQVDLEHGLELRELEEESGPSS